MDKKFVKFSKKAGALALAAAMTIPTMVQPMNVFAVEQENTAIVSKQTYIVGTIDANELELDVTVPLGGIQFNIDSEGVMTTKGMVIKSNTIAPLFVTITDVEGQAEQTDIDGTVTNFPAPRLVEKTAHADWNNLDYETTVRQIAIALHQVDAVDDGEGNMIAGDSYTGNMPFDFQQLMDEMPSDAKITHLDSAFGTDGTYAAIDILNDDTNTKYGKTWLGNGQYKVGYALDLEFSYPGFNNYIGE